MSGSDELGIAGFANATRYHAARPSYPAEAVAYMATMLRLTSTSRVLDLGAGTGIFSRLLQPLVAEVVAVEPTPAMRDTMSRECPGIHVLDGRDTAIPLDDRAVDAVVAAQAFHWFDAPPALREIHRVLRPGGGLGLIWNERDTSEPWVQDLTVAMQWDRRAPYRSSTDYGAVVAGGPFGDVRHERFHYHDTLSHDDVRQRVLTTSYISLMEPAEQRALLAEVDAVLAPLPSPVVLPYVTDVYTANALADQ